MPDKICCGSIPTEAGQEKEINIGVQVNSRLFMDSLNTDYDVVEIRGTNAESNTIFRVKNDVIEVDELLDVGNSDNDSRGDIKGKMRAYVGGDFSGDRDIVTVDALNSDVKFSGVFRKDFDIDSDMYDIDGSGSTIRGHTRIGGNADMSSVVDTTAAGTVDGRVRVGGKLTTSSGVVRLGDELDGQESGNVDLKIYANEIDANKLFALETKGGGHQVRADIWARNRIDADQVFDVQTNSNKIKANIGARVVEVGDNFGKTSGDNNQLYFNFLKAVPENNEYYNTGAGNQLFVQQKKKSLRGYED
eukprot:Platyproteum_vivax@DN7605_c1_g1_i19.p1